MVGLVDHAKSLMILVNRIFYRQTRTGHHVNIRSKRDLWILD